MGKSHAMVGGIGQENEFQLDPSNQLTVGIGFTLNASSMHLLTLSLPRQLQISWPTL